MINRFTHSQKVLKTLTLFSLSISTLVFFSLPAFADQCAYISKKQALEAVSRLQVGQTLYHLCEPCGETVPKVVKIESLSVGTVGYEDFWQVQVNNEGIDLAYVYIETNPRKPPINLAAVSGCPTTDVSRFLPTPNR